MFSHTRIFLLRPFVIAAVLAAICAAVSGCSSGRQPFARTGTIAGLGKEFGEPFALASRKDEIFVSDGEKGEIAVVADGKVRTYAAGLDTPAAIVFNKAGDLLVVDSGAGKLLSLDAKGAATQLADGFRGPTGLAVDEAGRIFVSDTYNDRICVIENGTVSTYAGGTRGYAEGSRGDAKFDTPLGIALWGERLLVADAGNRRIRVVEPDGRVWTLAGNGASDLKDGLLLHASFVEPTAIAVSEAGEIFIADGNAIRVITADVVPAVRTLTNERRGFEDGPVRRARFNRPSGLAFDQDGALMIADAENRVVRSLTVSAGSEATSEQISAMSPSAAEFRSQQGPRWPFDPPERPRDIAGTLGELRGDVKPGNADLHFHNGLDIAGAYGETARSVRTEKVLRPLSTTNFGTLRELIRMPTLGYIHVRLGRNSDDKPFGDGRFLFERDASGRLVGVRVPRGTKFKAGEPIGTLNSMNHVHLIAGRPGSEMNAIDALAFPGIADSRPPTVEKVVITDENWKPFETKTPTGRIEVRGGVRILMRAFDQMDGNSDRRRLGLYRAGYQLLEPDASEAAEPQWTIFFDRLPDERTVPLVYAEGSHSGATGETIFQFIVTNRVEGGAAAEGFLDTSTIDPGPYILRACGADYFGNTGCGDVNIEVLRP